MGTFGNGLFVIVCLSGSVTEEKEKTGTKKKKKSKRQKEGRTSHPFSISSI